MQTRILAASLTVLALFLTACSTTQTRHRMLVSETYPPKPHGFEVEVFLDGLPQRPFKRIARLDTHLEKTHFVQSSLSNALPELKRQARLVGADAVIEIREMRSSVGETDIFHVTAIAVVYTE
jgi:hypothetical protein